MKNVPFHGAAGRGLTLAFLWLNGTALAEKPAPRPEKPGVCSLEVCSDGARLHMLLGELAEPGAPPVLTHQISPDAGATWSAPVQVNAGAPKPHGLHRGSDARLAARGDHVVVAWTGAGTDAWGSGPISVVASRDSGRTWVQGANPADDGMTDGHNFLALGADQAGGFHLAWLDKRDGDRGLRYASSADGGLLWTGNVTPAPKTCECCWNAIAPLSGGRMAILFRDRSPRDMRVVTSTPGGQGWMDPVSVGDFKWQFNACPHVGGALVTRSTPAGEQLHAAVWTGAPGAAGLYHLRSEDAGRSWSAPHKMNVPLAWHPAMAVDATGRIAVAWDTMAASAPETWAVLSADGGVHWGAPVRLSVPETPAAHPRIVAAGKGFRVFWTEEKLPAPAVWKSVVFPGE